MESENIKENLQACPFCGSKAEKHYSSQKRCSICKAVGPSERNADNYSRRAGWNVRSTTNETCVKYGKKVKACPWCGIADKDNMRVRYEHREGHKVVCACDRWYYCAVQGPAASSKAQAINAWNQRV